MIPPSAPGNASPEPDPASRPPGKWVRIALALSLAVNLGVAGIVAGAVFRHGRQGHVGMVARDVGFGPYTEALTPEDRSQLRRAFWAVAPQMRDNHRAIRADITELLAQLRAAPFNPDGLRQVFDRQSARNAERLELGQRLIFDLVEDMTAEARLAFADRLEQSLSRRSKRQNGTDAP